MRYLPPCGPNASWDRDPLDGRRQATENINVNVDYNFKINFIYESFKYNFSQITILNAWPELSDSLEKVQTSLMAFKQQPCVDSQSANERSLYLFQHFICIASIIKAKGITKSAF